MLATTSQVGGKHLRARTAGVGVAPEFMPKRNPEVIDIRGWRADDPERPEIGEQQGSCQLSDDTCNADGAVILHDVRRTPGDVPDQPALRLVHETAHAAWIRKCRA
ncbi:MAG TPA: hypothetical protein VLK30_06290 [Candidatus Limnocylindrales bacterium]|nr:hypothetical protein [Candidatus Limnocylindrales bacterium]